MAIDSLQNLRPRFLPMLQAATLQYRNRVPDGYPSIVDTPENGAIGMEIDPSHALYLVRDGDSVSARMYRRAPRTDARATAGRQKYAGVPFSDDRQLPPEISDHELRNLIAELMSWYNTQPGLIHITDD